MRRRGGELLAADESTVDAESLFDVMVMKDSKSGGRLPNSASPDESNGCQFFCQSDDLPDQLVTSETGPRRRRR